MSEQAPPGPRNPRVIRVGHRDEAEGKERGEPQVVRPDPQGIDPRGQLGHGDLPGIFTAIVIGGLLNAFTNATVLDAWGNFFSAPAPPSARPGTRPSAPTWRCSRARSSTRTRWQRCSSRIDQHRHSRRLPSRSVQPAVRDLRAGHAAAAGRARVALPYQAGMFNIGAQSQFIGGAILATTSATGSACRP